MTAPMTPGLANLAAALAKVQAELPKLERDRTVEVQQKNGGTYSYSYVTLANLSDAILPLLAKHGLSFAAMPGAGADGKMCVRYHLMHESGEVLTGEFPVSGEGGIQMIGGRITYARRYCLAAIVGVAADEDDESRLSDDGARGTAQRAAPRQRPQRPAPAEDRPTAQRARAATAGQPPLPDEPVSGPPAVGAALMVTDAQQRKMHALFRDVDLTDRTERLRYVGEVLSREVGSSTELTRQEAAQVIDALERWAANSQPTAEEIADVAGEQR